MKPELCTFISEGMVKSYEDAIRKHIAANPSDLNSVADLANYYLKDQQYERFKAVVEGAGEKANSSVFRRLRAKYLLFAEKDVEGAKEVLLSLSREDSLQPAWVHYFAGLRRAYFERVHEGVLYTAIPKNASTSLKTFILREVENSPELDPHSVFGNPFFAFQNFSQGEIRDSVKVAVIRRPEDRFISYYRKNIVSEDSLAFEYGTTSAETPELFGLPLKPSLSQFIEHHSRYCIVFNDVFHHTLPQAAYLGDMRNYDFVCDVSEVDSLVRFVAKAIGMEDRVPVRAPREMVGSSTLAEPDFDGTEALRKLYADDYCMLAFSQANPVISDEIRRYSPQSPVFSFLRA